MTEGIFLRYDQMRAALGNRFEYMEALTRCTESQVRAAMLKATEEDS